MKYTLTLILTFYSILVSAQTGGRKEIYAYGLRNAWKCSFDPITHKLWAGDVGQNKYEEVDTIINGGNYGWRVKEGYHCFNPSTNCDSTGFQSPVLEYSHTVGFSVTGGYVYRGTALPDLVGKYIYADLNGKIWALTYEGLPVPQNELLLDMPVSVTSFGVDQNNELYIVAYHRPIRIYRLVKNGGVYQTELAFPAFTFDSMALDLQHIPDGSNRLVVAQQQGRVYIFDNVPTPQPKIFLDMKDRVSQSGGELGLLGIAFHPKFSQNGFLYVNYTINDGIRWRSFISRFQASGPNKDTVYRATEKFLLQVYQPYSNHNGGWIGFGPDGYLYTSLGDGGSGGDPQNRAQNRDSLLGKILRIDVNDTTDGKPYGIPPTNPFASVAQHANIQTLRIYPNPSNGAIHIESGINQIASLTVIDVNGKAIFRKEVDIPSVGIAISTEDFPAGKYSVIIESPKAIETGKFIINK